MQVTFCQYVRQGSCGNHYTWKKRLCKTFHFSRVTGKSDPGLAVPRKYNTSKCTCGVQVQIRLLEPRKHWLMFTMHCKSCLFSIAVLYQSLFCHCSCHSCCSCVHHRQMLTFFYIYYIFIFLHLYYIVVITKIKSFNN